MHFRKDINGLRAIAVLAVVLFHFNPHWMPGGFAGVDVFFVISGFLMTGIIFRGIENDNFSVLKFYLARANRIIPALLALCCFLLVLGWFLLTPADYRNLGINTASSAVFISNIIYWLESGYFAPGVESNLLLHTWSLSVEWQFYLIYPIILHLLSKRFTLQTIKQLIIFTTLFGFIYSLYSSIYSPSAAYFLLPSRFWEMTLGGIAYLYPVKTKHYSKNIEYIGLLLIVLSLFIVTENDLWPGYMSLLPAIGAYLVIISNIKDSFLTANRFSLFIGKISYSIYLWHWPIHVFLYNSELDNLYTNILGILASIILGFVSYSLFEGKKYAVDKINFINLLKFKPVIYSLLVFTSASIIYLFNGMINYSYFVNSEASSYINRYINYLDRDEIKAKYHKDFIEDRYDDISQFTKNSGVFLWGDSHANALIYGLETVFREEGTKFQASYSSACFAGIGIGVNKKKKGTDDYNQCLKSNQYAVNFIKEKKPKVVLFAQYKEHDLNDFAQIVDAISDDSIIYIILGPVPQWRGTLPSRIAYKSLDKAETYMDNIRPWLKPLDKRMKKKYRESKIQYISLLDKLCKNETSCLAKVDTKNSALAWDYGHLTLEGSYFVSKQIIYPEISSHLK